MDIEGFSPRALDELSASLGYELRQHDDRQTAEFSRLRGQLAADIGALTSAVYATQQVVSGQLDSILDAARNPAATAATEMLRRGSVAWRHGWWSDAVRDLSASIATYPYRAAPHLLLGLSRLGLGDSVGAMSAYRDAIRYGAAADADCGATAALLGAQLAEAAGASPVATELLVEADKQLPPCIEILAALVRRHCETETRRERLLDALISSGRADQDQAGLVAGIAETRLEVASAWAGDLERALSGLERFAAEANVDDTQRRALQQASQVDASIDIGDSPVTRCIALARYVGPLLKVFDDAVLPVVGELVPSSEQIIAVLDDELAHRHGVTAWIHYRDVRATRVALAEERRNLQLLHDLNITEARLALDRLSTTFPAPGSIAIITPLTAATLEDTPRSS